VARRAALVACLALALASCDRDGVPPPDTVAPEWQDHLRRRNGATSPPVPDASDRGAWQRRQAQREAASQPSVDAALARYAPVVTERTLGGVRVLDVRPRGHRDGDVRALVHLHGGGYTMNSARSVAAEQRAARRRDGPARALRRLHARGLRRSGAP